MAGFVSSKTTRTLAICLFLLAGTIAIFAKVSHGTFLRYDDDRYVTDNWHVRAGLHWNTVKWAFSSFEQANWHPLTWLSHALDCQLFGLNPAAHHDMNVLLHAANVLLLFLLLQTITGDTGRSFVAAALFAVHPINVESVAWIAERKNVLCMFSLLITLLAYADYVRRPRLARYAAVFVLVAMALMAKPMTITLPLVLLLLDYWPLGRMSFSRPKSRGESPEAEIVSAHRHSILWLLLEKLPLLFLSATSAFLTVKAQGAAGAITILYPVRIRLQNAVVSYVLYLGKAIWPARLAALYPYPAGGWPGWIVALSALLLIASTLLAFWFRNKPYLLWGWLWFVVTMVPMIGAVQVGNQAMADRYAYLPFVGLFVMATWAIADLMDRLSLAVRSRWALAAVVIIAFSAITVRQLSYWRDDYSLWSHTLAVTQRNFVAEDNLGNALIQQGRYYEGIAHFRRAAEIQPGDPVSEINLGIYAQQQGNLKEALARYEYVLQLTSDPLLRASAYANLGGVYFTLHDYERARENFVSSLKWKGNFPFVFCDLGLIAQKSGRWSDAVNYYAMYAAVDPNDVAFFLLGQSLEKTGDSQRAKLAYERAEDISKDLNQTKQKALKLLSN